MSAAAPPAPAKPPLPALRQDVVITLPDREQYRARVTRVTDEEIVRVVRPLALARLDADGAPDDWLPTLTVNVSGNGLLAAGHASLAVGDAVAFRLTPADGEPPIEGRGRVARSGADGQRGIAIEQIDRDVRRRLVRFVFEQERVARRRTRDGEP
jgi:hypothetical protein